MDNKINSTTWVSIAYEIAAATLWDQEVTFATATSSLDHDQINDIHFGGDFTEFEAGGSHVELCKIIVDILARNGHIDPHVEHTAQIVHDMSVSFHDMT